jgi:murein DD-endopeptidase MepM/ murein hydrolase activator NlpD
LRTSAGVILFGFASTALLFSGIFLAFPSSVGAFWPFVSTQAAGSPTPLLHDPSMDLMQAPMSTEVDDLVSTADFTTQDGTALIPDATGNGIIASSTDIDTAAAPTDDVLTTPSSGTISQYTVQAGDSISGIAQKFGVSVDTILWANDITDPSTIKEGTVLVILPVSGIQHTVRAGETLSSIAEKFGADASDIAQFNGIPADGTLTAGSTIIIPGGELPSSDTSDTSSSNSSESKSSSKKTKSGDISSTAKDSSSSEKSSDKTSSGSSSDSGKMNYSDESGNPYRGGGGAPLPGFFVNPLPGALLTQGLHGLDAVDLGAPSGTPIHAAAKGTVILARTGGWNGGYGNYVILDNGSGVETLYAHMSEVKAQMGETVSAGDVIGLVGMTGDATGPHLHFEVRGAQNPFSYCQEMTVCADPS